MLIKENINKIKKVIKLSFAIHRPVFSVINTYYRVKNQLLDPMPYVLLDYYNWENRDTCLMLGDYLKACRKINPATADAIMDNKIILFERCGDLMKRDAIDLKKASKEEVAEFIKTHGRFVGKCNLAVGKGFSIYENSESDSSKSIEEIIASIEENGQDILEGYIEQHPAVSAIYPKAVNTIRIHTVRRGKEVRTFIKPKMRIGSSNEITDIRLSDRFAYRLILNEDGSVENALAVNRYKVKKCEFHADTKARLTGIVIPYVPQAIEMVKEAAVRIPELAYIGWDVAIGKDGPVLVEGNAISGCFLTYQRITKYLYNRGMKDEIMEMLSFGLNTEASCKESKEKACGGSEKQA